MSSNKLTTPQYFFSTYRWWGRGVISPPLRSTGIDTLGINGFLNGSSGSTIYTVIVLIIGRLCVFICINRCYYNNCRLLYCTQKTARLYATDIDFLKSTVDLFYYIYLPYTTLPSPSHYIICKYIFKFKMCTYSEI